MGAKRIAAKASTRLKGTAALGLALFALWGAPAQAQTPLAAPTFVANNALGRFLLPYSPVVFDIAVQIGRSFAEITYGARGYDPLTQTFTVSDLHIRRDALDFTAQRLRVGLASTQLQGFSVDLSEFSLPPDVRNGLAALGQERLTGDAVITIETDDARAAFDFGLEMAFERVGQLSLSGAVDGFHVLIPLEDVGMNEDGTTASAPPKVAGTLRGLSLTYRDLGLVDAATAIAAQGQGVSPDEMRAGLAAMPLMSVGALLDGLPGGASPALRDQAQEWARAAGDFVQRKGEIRVTLAPPEPVPLARFASGVVDEALIAALNPSVTTPDPAAGPATVAAGLDALGSANALVSGVGALQDREAGASALLQLARGGDAGAVRALAGAFGNAPAPDLGPNEAAALYGFLLVGRATGSPVSDASLGELAAGLGPVALRGAELQAGAWFRANTAAGQGLAVLSPESIRGLRPADLRRQAFDAYEGRAVPRDFTEAYALALVAAAAGDRLAESLRDDLAQAAHEKRLVIATEEARTRATALWTAYAAGGAQPMPAPEPQAQPVESEPQPQASEPTPAEQQEAPAPEAPPAVNTPLPIPDAP